MVVYSLTYKLIVALRNEKGSYNTAFIDTLSFTIVALRNEKGSYNAPIENTDSLPIVALRNEKGSIQIKKHHLNR